MIISIAIFQETFNSSEVEDFIIREFIDSLGTNFYYIKNKNFRTQHFLNAQNDIIEQLIKQNEEEQASLKEMKAKANIPDPMTPLVAFLAKDNVTFQDCKDFCSTTNIAISYDECQATCEYGTNFAGYLMLSELQSKS